MILADGASDQAIGGTPDVPQHASQHAFRNDNGNLDIFPGDKGGW